MRVTQTVFAVFHHFELAHQLQRRGHLAKIYSTWPWARLKREGLPKEFVETFATLHTATTLLGRTGRLPVSADTFLNKWNTLTFDNWTARRISPCDALISISGSGLKTGRKVQREGGKFICDRGSTHQRYQEQIVAAEHKRWNVPPPYEKPHIVVREEAIYEQADAISVPSTVAARSFIAMGIPAEKLHVIPYGVRLDKFKPTAVPDSNRFDVLFAGAIGLRKGVPYLLEAFARVKHPNKHLTFVGAVQDDLRSVLPRLPQQHVTFTGTLSQPELAARMSASHVMVLPSIEEGLALVQGQAMACGCPVIATRATGSEDLFTHDVEGFIVPERDIDALATRMQQIAGDPALRQRLSEACLRRVKSLGGWDRYGDLWDDLLHTLTGLPRDPGEPDYIEPDYIL